MTIDICTLATFDGPNRFDPRPGVLAYLRAGRDYGPALRLALKDVAQRIGLVIATPHIDSRTADGEVWHEAFFVTPMPAIGAEMLRYTVALLNARDACDEEWDADERLWDLQKKRRAEAMPLPALQLIAEASARGIPAFVRRDGLLQIGYGARGYVVDPALFRRSGSNLRSSDVGTGAPPFAQSPVSSAIPWERLGVVPVVVVSGGRSQSITGLFAAQMQERRGGTVSVLSASFDAARDCLIDPYAETVILDLDPVDLLQRGLPVEQCVVSALLDLPEALVSKAGSRDDLARALGVALLVTAPDGRGILNADDPAILALADYAPCPVILIAHSEHAALRAHRASGGSTLFLRNQEIVVACGWEETIVTPSPDLDPWQALVVEAFLLALAQGGFPG
ncbi:MAG: DUF4938 domain-containing protein [Roseiflexus sp.]